MQSIIKFSLFLGLFILQSCSHNHWVSGTKSNSMLEADLSNCQQSANSQFPPKIVKRVKTTVAPVATRTIIDPPPRPRVRVVESYTPVLESEQVDENMAPRESAVKKCMHENQWELQEEKHGY